MRQSEAAGVTRARRQATLVTHSHPRLQQNGAAMPSSGDKKNTSPALTAYSSRLNAAASLAAKAHQGQMRKKTEIPYIAHPFQVALILDRHGFGEDLVLAGLLHDVLEDTDTPEAAIRWPFGDEVLRLVQAVTEHKEEHGRKRPWRVRKEEQLAHLRQADAPIAALKAADALHNIRTLLEDLQTQGVATMSRFNASLSESIWYNRSIAETVQMKLGTRHPLAVELAAAAADLAAWEELE
jgi:(p)ppGpp synthase/HD superfamily hydrolase